MVKFNLKTPKLIYLVLIFCVVFIGCDSNSSGSKESQQLNNDHDPTAIEKPEGHDTQMMETSNEMNENGEFVVIRDFDQNNWQKFSDDFKLGTVENSDMTRINSKTMGSNEWKSWGDYQYRVIYFSEGGALKAKPMLKNRGNEEIDFSPESIDSLNINDLWITIQRNASSISNNYK